MLLSSQIGIMLDIFYFQLMYAKSSNSVEYELYVFKIKGYLPPFTHMDTHPLSIPLLKNMTLLILLAFTCFLIYRL